MRLLNFLILILIKTVNTERYELIHPMSKVVKLNIDNYLLSLKFAQKKNDNLSLYKRMLKSCISFGFFNVSLPNIKNGSIFNPHIKTKEKRSYSKIAVLISHMIRKYSLNVVKYFL